MKTSVEKVVSRYLEARALRMDKRAIAELAKDLAKYVYRKTNGRDPLGKDILTRQPYPYVVKAVDGSLINAGIILKSEETMAPSYVVDGGMGLYKGHPIVIVTINGSTVIPKNTAGVLERQLFPVLLHELTHVADKYKGRGVAPDMSRDEAQGNAAYYNDPGEVQAYMQEVVDEVETKSKHFSMFWDRFGPSKGLDYLLKSSDTWTEISPLLDGVQQALGHQGRCSDDQRIHGGGVMHSAQRVVSRYVLSRRDPFTEADIEKLRKDFLLLVSNVPRVVEAWQNNDLVTYAEFHQVVLSFRKAFNNLFFERFLNRLNRGGDVSDEDAKGLKNVLATPAWDLYYELSTLPERPSSFRDIEAWDKRIRRKGQAFWKKAKDTLKWYEAARKAPLTVRVPDRLVLEGFQVEVVGYKDNDADYMARTKEALKQYRVQAKQRMPWLIQHQLPIVLDFEGGLNKGGSYERTYLWINGTAGMAIDEKVKIYAHEMGHHRFKHLSGSAVEFWNTAIKQDYGPLNIQEVLDKWPGNSKYAFGFVDAWKDKDPVLALQVDVLSFGHGGGKAYDSKDDFIEALATSDVLNVPKTPVTGYGGKNPEEAFCEAIGLLVAYGPRAVHARIRHWLDIILPGETKTASRVAKLYLARQGLVENRSAY